MATRTQAREVVVGMLYAYDLGNDNIPSIAKSMLEEKKIKNNQQVFALNLLNGVIENLLWLDSKLQPLLKEWDFKRLGGMERSILRLGAYEILCTDTDIPIVINEAIELGKHYGGEDNAPKLLNGVLDALSKTYKLEKNTLCDIGTESTKLDSIKKDDNKITQKSSTKHTKNTL